MLFKISLAVTAFNIGVHSSTVQLQILTFKGIDGERIRDLMTETMHHRFGQVNELPYNIQWLTDNGPCYVARETVLFDRSIGLDICTTRPYSPESNRMAEVFFKTFKRDHVWLGDLACADRVLDQLPGWFEDYNENPPHKGLKMMSPR